MCVRCQNPDYSGGYIEGAGGVLCFDCLDDLGIQNSKEFLEKYGESEND